MIQSAFKLILTLAIAIAFAQDPATNQQASQIQVLKQELETLRKKRDQVVALRWSAREKNSQARSKVEDKIQAKKEQLDIVASEKARILDEFRGIQSEMEVLRQKREEHRAKFLRLSDQISKLETFKQIRKQGPRLNEAQATQDMNKMTQQIEIQKDQPRLIWELMQQLALNEIDKLSQIDFQQREIVRNGKPQEGYVARLGGITAFSTDAAFTQPQQLLVSKQKDQLSLSWRADLLPEVSASISSFVKSMDKSQSQEIQIFWAPFDVLQSPNTLKVNASAENQGFVSWFQGLFESGGPVSYPIAAIFVIALGMCLERWIKWFRNSRFRGYKIDAFFKLVDEGDSQKIDNYIKANFPGALGRVLTEIHSKRDQPRENIETLVEEALLHEIPTLEKGLNTISVLGGAAPLLGLLGTVYGMIVLFDQITLHGTSDPKLLAGGISIALVTTQMGLAVAIPIQLVQNFVANRMDNLITEIEKNSVRMMNHLWAKK